jgi:uncharacterized protein YegP (UPF0339 family)
MASKFEIYKNKSGDFRWRPIHKAKANSMSGINSVKENAPMAPV